ncbi:MAG: immunoglobulin domain-containing protein [Planctomycetota bacterium]
MHILHASATGSNEGFLGWTRGALLLLALACCGDGFAQGPDVIVGELYETSSYGAIGTTRAYSVGTISCNIGTSTLQWIAGTNQHPVITQNLFRLANNRFEQLGQGWIKHAFTALQGSVCTPCTPHPNGTALGVGCSDPYSSGLNGSQSGLGPKSDINAATGLFTYPYTGQGLTGNTLFKRIQAEESDLSVPGALYFVTSHYMTSDEPPVGTHLNNESYRRVTLSGSFTMSVADTTQRQKYAVQAWVDQDPSVTMTFVDVPGDGRFIVCAKAVPDGANWRYEYAIENYNSDRSASSFAVPIPSGSAVTAIGFHDVDYHSNEIYANTDWSSASTATQVSWQSPQTFAQNPNTNALRWDTVYSFWFTSDQPPTSGNATLGLFKPGAPTSMTFTTVVPGTVGSPPFNDLCTNALTASAGSTPFSTLFATTSGPAEPTCASTVNADVWYRYTAPCDGTAVFSLCGASFDTQLAIYQGPACPTSSSALACNDNACSLQSEVTLAVTNGTEYLIRIGGSGSAQGNGALVITPPNCTPPGSGNDLCADAIAVSDGVPINGSTTNATVDGTASCGSSGASPDVWYTYTPATSASVSISTCNTANYDTVLAVFTGCGGAQVACLDDTAGCSGFTQTLTVSLTGGVTYWIRVAGYNGASGDFTLLVTGGGGTPGPMNDDCADRIGIALGTISFDTTGATTDGPLHAACNFFGSSDVTNDIWYNYPSTFAGTLTVSTCGSSYDTKVAIYDDAGCANFEARLLACNDDSCATQSELVIPVVANRNYTLRVGGYNGATGAGTLTLSAVPDSCPLVTSGLVLHLETDTGVATSGTTVTGWTDQSGQGNDLIALGAPMRVVGALGAEDAIAFDGFDDALVRTAALNGLATGSADRSVFTVVRYLDNGDGGFAYGGTGCNQSFGVIAAASGDLAIAHSCAQFEVPVAGAGVGWLTHAAVLTAGSLRHYRDGVLIDTASHVFATAGSTLRVGTNIGATSFADMDVAAILVYDRALNETERAQVEAYLQDKYFSVPCTGNAAPVAVSDSGTVATGGSLVVTVLANDTDDVGLDAASVEILHRAASGTLTVNGATGAITYLHDGSSSTSDSFTYTVRDTDGAISNAGTVVMTIDSCTGVAITGQPGGTTVCAGDNVTLNVATSGTAPVSYQWRRNGVNVAGATSASLALTNVTVASAGNYDVLVSNACGAATSNTAVVVVQTLPQITLQPASQSGCVGAPLTLVAAATGTSPISYQWRKNGTNIGGATSASLAFGSLAAVDAGNYDVLISNPCGTVFSSTAVVSVSVEPTVVTRPVSQSACQGATVTLNVTAAGTAPLSYQWRRNGTNVGGATSATLTLMAITPASAGSYDVVVSNSCGTTTSAVAVVVVDTTPQIVTGPTAQSGCPGASVSLSVTATGATGYQWRRNGVNVGGATSPVLNLTNLGVGNAGTYDVVVTNGCGSVTSAAAVVTLLTAPTISVHPSPASECPGGSVSLAVTASGSGPLSYQWRRNGTSVAGGTGSTLLLSGLSAATAGSYDVVVSNGCGSATSNVAAVTLLAAPLITSGPAPVDTCLGDAVSFSVAATGSAPLSHQWRRNGVALPGANASVLSLPSVSAADVGSYDVVVTNGCGSATSASVSLTLMSAPTIVTEPIAQMTCEGFAVSLSVSAQGTPPLMFQWFHDGQPVAGAQAAILTLASVELSDAGAYRVDVSNSCGTVASATALLQVAAQADCDCNSNGVLDGDEIQGGSVPDCNSNGVPDSCDIASGTSQDTNLDGVPDECGQGDFKRGDANGDDLTNIADAIFVLNYQFGGGPTPGCLDTADTNDDGTVNIADVVYLLAWLFTEGPDPQAPFPGCGTDPSVDALSCDTSPCP